MSLRALGLELGAPTALWGLALALPLLVLHLYHRRRVRVVVPFLPLLLESTGPARREARFKRLREVVALGLRLTALACLVLALAGLQPAQAAVPQEDLLLVVDGDVSMAVREADGAPRLGQALARAEAWIRSRPLVGDTGAQLDAPVSVLLASDPPRLLVPPTTDRARALSRLAQTVRPAAATTDLDAAVRMAIDTGAPAARALVVVLSPRALSPPVLPDGMRLVVQGVGEAREDQGILDFAVEAAPDEPVYKVRLHVRNEADAPRRRTLEVRVEEVLVAQEDLTLPVEEPVEVSVSVPAPAAPSWLEVRLAGEDVFPLNDVAHARLRPTRQPSVLVVHGGAVRPYTAAVLEALAAGGFVDSARSGYVHARDLAQAERRDVTLVDGVALSRDALRPGAYIFLAPLAGALPFDLGPDVRDPLVWRTESDHPLMAGLDFRRAFVLRGRPLAGPELTPLAYAEGQPVIGEGERGGVRYVALGLDPEGSALPGQTALPDFIRRALLRLARAPVAPLAPVYRRGDLVRPAVPLPGGPEGTLSWAGPTQDPLLATVGRGRVHARFAPDGPAWRVPAGASGRTTLVTTSGGTPWTGRTALFDAEPDRSVVPVRPPAAAPRPARARADPSTNWRRGLLAAALALLLIDLLAVTRVGTRGAAPQS